MSNKLQRILKRDKPKADILENMTRTWFKNSDAPEAIVTIKPNTASRSVKQNAFYWRMVSIIADDTGNSPDALHTYFSSQFLEPLIEEVNNKPVVVIKSTTKLTVNEMSKHLLKVVDFADDLGIRLDLPDDWRGLVTAEVESGDTGA